MLFASAIGVLSALVVLIAMSRIDIRKFMGYPAIMDILVTCLLIMMLHGSYVGMVAAVIGGLVFSGMITVIRKCMGYKRIHRHGVRFVWVDYPAKYNAPTLNLKGMKIPYKAIAVVILVMVLV